MCSNSACSAAPAPVGKPLAHPQSHILTESWVMVLRPRALPSSSEQRQACKHAHAPSMHTEHICTYMPNTCAHQRSTSLHSVFMCVHTLDRHIHECTQNTPHTSKCHTLTDCTHDPHTYTFCLHNTFLSTHASYQTDMHACPQCIQKHTDSVPCLPNSAGLGASPLTTKESCPLPYFPNDRHVLGQTIHQLGCVLHENRPPLTLFLVRVAVRSGSLDYQH